MSRKDKIIISSILIAFAVVFIILVAQIAILIMNKGTVGQGAPDDAFRELVSAMNDGDLQRVYGVSIYSLNMSYDEYQNAFGAQEPGSDFAISIRTINVVAKDEMDQDQTSQIDELMPTLKEIVGGDVSDYCMIEFSLKVTTTKNGESQTDVESGSLVGVLVDSKWYLLFPFDENQTSTPAVSLSKTSVTEGVKISVMSISSSDVSWGDVRITINDGGNFATWNPSAADLGGGIAKTFNYSNQPLGSIWVCCQVTDLAGNGIINNGDYIVLTSYMNSMTFSTSTTYTVTLVYDPTAEQMAMIPFTG